jgi:hypothetical protein
MGTRRSWPNGNPNSGWPVIWSVKNPLRRSYTRSDCGGRLSGSPQRTNGLVARPRSWFPDSRFSRTSVTRSACGIERRPYREIAQLLAQRCGVRVSHSTLHEFVHRYFEIEPLDPSEEGRRRSPTGSVQAGYSRSTKIAQRIDALKQKPTTRRNDSTGFQFDDSEALRLKPGKT